MYADQIDWYEHQHELEAGLIFQHIQGGYVMLDRSVPGDGTKWYVADWIGGRWLYEDATIEPGELMGEPLCESDLPRMV